MTIKEARRMCVSFRVDPTTLKMVEQERGDKTLSATMNARISGVLSILSSKAKGEVNDEK